VVIYVTASFFFNLPTVSVAKISLKDVVGPGIS